MKQKPEKHYAGDWAKEKSRDLVRQVIQRNLLKFKKPKDLSVLCLPGIDAQEILDVYDPLGIPRENITGLENVPRIAQQIKDKDLGIHVVPQSVEEFAKGLESHDFDIISLDYTGPINEGQLDALAKLSHSQKLNHYVLHHANLMRRDWKSMGHYASAFPHVEKWGEPDSILGVANNFQTLTRNFGRGVELASEKSGFKDLKGVVYPYLLRSCFLAVAPGDLEGAIKTLTGAAYGETKKILLENIGRIFGIEVDIDSPLPLFESMGEHGLHPGIVRFIEEAEVALTRNTLKRMGLGAHEGNVLTLLTAINDSSKTIKHFYEKDLESYSYVSESGDPMMGEVYFLSHPERKEDAAKDVLHAMEHWKDTGRMDFDAFMGLLIKFHKEGDRFRSPELIETLAKKGEVRMYLGSSAKPVLSQKRAIEEFNSGLTDQEIKNKYRGWKNKPLAQWRAHFTMGTYEDSKEQVEEDLDLEEITKEGALYFLAEEIPPQEIYDAYPTSFSVGQLRAFKAHQTMGTYEK